MGHCWTVTRSWRRRDWPMAKPSALKDWLHYLQVERDLTTKESMLNLLCRLPWNSLTSRGRGFDQIRPHLQISTPSFPAMVRNAVVNLARQRAAEALRAKGVNNDIIDRLPSIEDGFVNWIRSDMPMEAIDEMPEHAVDSLN
ncbi:MAG: hypothetical protein CM15mP128_0490 [Methanobacteriota archaeon]|nr:MAG: hypothetical protein CM15mP128_0490 [Euryarchaeota archaeon]